MSQSVFAYLISSSLLVYLGGDTSDARHGQRSKFVGVLYLGGSPAPAVTPVNPERALGKSRRKQKPPAPLSCVDPTVYLFIYLVAFLLSLGFFFLTTAAAELYVINISLSHICQPKKKKKKVCEALHKRGRLNTQLCSAQLR